MFQSFILQFLFWIWATLQAGSGISTAAPGSKQKYHKSHIFDSAKKSDDVFNVFWIERLRYKNVWTSLLKRSCCFLRSYLSVCPRKSNLPCQLVGAPDANQGWSQLVIFIGGLSEDQKEQSQSHVTLYEWYILDIESTLHTIKCKAKVKYFRL